METKKEVFFRRTRIRMGHQQKPRPSGRKGFLGGNKQVQEQVRSMREGDCGVTQGQIGDHTLTVPWGSVQAELNHALTAGREGGTKVAEVSETLALAGSLLHVRRPRAHRSLWDHGNKCCPGLMLRSQTIPTAMYPHLCILLY